jgi:hypothetical protein
LRFERVAEAAYRSEEKMSEKRILRWYAPRGEESKSTYFNQLMRETLGVEGWMKVGLGRGTAKVDPKYMKQVQEALKKSGVRHNWYVEVT